MAYLRGAGSVGGAAGGILSLRMKYELRFCEAKREEEKQAKNKKER